MKRILQMSFADVNDKHSVKNVNVKNILLENKKLVSFSAIILEGVYKNTKIDFSYIDYNGSHVDFRTSYKKIFKNDVEYDHFQCDNELNNISSLVALKVISTYNIL